MRQAEALKLRLAGATYQQVSEQLHCGGKGNAHLMVQKALLATIQEPADDVRALELARLDRLLLALWGQATTPGGQQLATVDRVLKIMAERRFYVLGLKVPEKIAPTTPDGLHPYDAEMGLAALLAQARHLVPEASAPTNGHALASRLSTEEDAC